jgi:SAM-dependent methyltransferase
MTEWWTEFFDDDYAAFGLANDPPEVIDRSVNFIIRALDIQPGETVFDQCCGIGRMSIPLARLGVHIIGVDLWRAYIQAARQRAESEHLQCQFEVGDAFTFVSPRKCDAAINWFTSFSYSLDDAANQRQLQNVFDSLRPGGRFLMDFINIPKVMAAFQPSIVTRSADAAQQGLIVLQEQKPDFLHGVMNSDWTFIYTDGRRVLRHISPRMYMPHEIAGMLTRCGFVGIDLMGSADGEPFDRLSSRLIIRSNKPE